MEPRADLFTTVHKGLRSMLYELSGRLQTNDFADVAATTALVRDLESDFALGQSAGCVVCILSHHAEDENAHIFGATIGVAKEMTESLIAEHHDLTRRELALARSAHELLAMRTAEDRVEAGARLNRNANDLLVAYLAHMNREENELVPVMNAHFTDPQLVALRTAIIAAMPPDRVAAILTYMLPSMNVHELVGFITSVRETAPAPAVKMMTELAASKVDAARWQLVKLRAGL